MWSAVLSGAAAPTHPNREADTHAHPRRHTAPVHRSTAEMLAQDADMSPALAGRSGVLFGDGAECSISSRLNERVSRNSCHVLGRGHCRMKLG